MLRVVYNISLYRIRYIKLFFDYKPPMEIQDIKASLSILTVLGSYNLKPNKNGMLSCPFHKDDKPSLKVYTETNTFNCFGCGANGDVIEFIQQKEKLSKHESILKAKSMADPSQITEAAQVNTKEDKSTLPRIAVLSKLATDSKASLKRTSKAKAYLRERKLDPDKTDAGYIGAEFGKGWNQQLQESGLQLGILKRNSQNNITPKFRSCLLFFTQNKKSQIVDIYGRSIIPNAEGKHFYLNGKHQGIYPAYPSKETRKLILTESLIDAATLLQDEKIKEDYSILALYGTNGLTSEIAEAIGELDKLEELIFFFDGDQAGHEAIKKYAERFTQERPKLKLSKVETPEEEDINSLLQGHDQEILLHLINERSTIRSTQKEEFKEASQEKEPGTLNTTNPDKITYTETPLEFTIWGGIEKENIHRLKLNLLVQLQEDDYRYYQDDVNLYSNAQLQRYIKGAGEELEVSNSLLKSIIRKLKSRIESYRLSLIEEDRQALKPKAYQMTHEQQKEAMRFLKSKELVLNTMDAIAKGGLIGEQRNGLLLFFLYLSRLFNEPLHAIIFGHSGSGKTYLQTKISECLPEESVRTITSLTENTLYYSAKDFWKHKLLLIEDLEGVYNAFLPLREFMSKQSISKLTTVKDSKGKNEQKVLLVEGPICVSGATTKASIYEDNANRSFLLHVDESPEHAKEVMDHQRNIQAGLVDDQQQEKHRQLLKNSQRLLQKVRVINPYAPMLDIPDCVFKKLRTNMHYLRLIEIISFYHQCQREWKTDKNGKPYICTTPEDIHWANYLIKDSLLRKSDELSGQLRHFFESLKKLADKKTEPKSFYAKEVREIFRMNPMTVNRYLRELENRGYIQRTGGNRKTGYEYEIRAWDEYEKLKSGMNILDEILQKVTDLNKGNMSITEV